MRAEKNPHKAEHVEATQMDCNSVLITDSGGGINVSGLSSPISIIQVFDNQWATVFECAGSCTSPSQMVSNLAAGQYYVKVDLLNADWSSICTKEVFVDVTDGGGGTGGGTGTGGTPDCTTATITSGSGAILVGNLVAPITLIQAFDSNWNQVYNCAGNCTSPGVTIPNLSAGTYFVKVDYLTNQWQSICKKEQFVTVGGGGTSTPTLSITDITVNESVGIATLEVRLSAPSATIVRVDYNTTNGTALNGEDFVGTSGILSFPSNTTSQLVSIQISDNNVFESTESFSVALSNPIGATIDDNSGVVTITDNDTQGGGGISGDCAAIQVSAGVNNSIDFSGLNAPVILLQVFDGTWNTVFNNFYTNSPGTINVPNLTAGAHYVKVDFLTNQWQAICKKEATINVGNNGGGNNGGGSTPPVASNDVGSVPAGGSVTINPLVNDNLNGGTNEFLIIVDYPSSGIVNPVGSGFVYTPFFGFAGSDAFTYRISNSNGQSNIATVTVSVTVVDPCAAQGGDTDGDGVCNSQDCQPNNPAYPATPGSACNDGDANTENDVVSTDGCGCAGTLVPSTLLGAADQPKFVNTLPTPMRLDARNGGTYDISMEESSQFLGVFDAQGNPMNTRVWGYTYNGNQTYGGPTIIAQKDVPIDVKWTNNLPMDHLLPVDLSIHQARPNAGVPTVVHLHGGHTEPESDGYPDAWFTQSWAETGAAFVKQTYHYSNDQEATQLWYHDHTLGRTRLNNYAGLAAHYLIRDNNETSLNLPSGEYEREIMIQDKQFSEDGSLKFPALLTDPEANDFPTNPAIEPTIFPEFFGDFILVNGKAWPKMDVQPTKYRFRVLNASDSRFYIFKLSNGATFQQIGTDGGFLNNPINLTQLVLAPAERADIIIDFSTMVGQSVTLLNLGPDEPFKGLAANQPPADPATTGQIMQFKVGLAATANFSIPNTLRQPIQFLGQERNTRQVLLLENMDQYGRLKPSLGTAADGVRRWVDPVTENPIVNQTEIWEVYNNTEDAHPIHIHQVFFQLLDRQGFTGDLDPATSKLTNIQMVGAPSLPAPNERGWKDTYIVPPGQRARFKIKFDLPGQFVWHCHILSHEDWDMMRPLTVREIVRQENRTLDGTENNLTNIEYGSAGSIYFRELPAQYGSSNPNGAIAGEDRPNPRHLSNRFGDEFEDKRNARQMSGLFYQWGQFIDHDFAGASGGSEPAPIPVPSYDPLMKAPIPFTRSKAKEGTGVNSPREQVNPSTSWLDGSQVYGIDADAADWLRSHQKGKMKVSSGGLLPFNTIDGEYDSPIDPTAPRMEIDGNRTRVVFTAGDLRANEHPMLTSLHTLMVLEHNRLCDQYAAQGMTDDELMYQKARKEVGALIQSVTYNQFLSALGVSLAPYTGYKPNVRPDIGNLFAAAAYRWHTMVENDVVFRDNECRGVGPIELPLKSIFNNPQILRKYGISSLFKGSTVHRQYETDTRVNSGLRNFLFGQGAGFDLVSININRGRDHGIPDYNTIRRHYLGSGASANDGVIESSTYQKLISEYGSIDKVDAWVGIFSEKLLPGKSVGKTLDAIIRRQFENMRDGDFYYFMNDPALSAADKQRIQNTTLGDILKRNTSVDNLQSNVFFAKNCSSNASVFDDLNDSGQPFCSGSAVRLYTNANSTSGVSISPGNYSISALASKGLPNDAISKIDVAQGFAITVFEHDNYSGKSAFFTSNSGALSPDWDNTISSVRVVCLNDAPSNDFIDCTGFGASLFDITFSSGIPIAAGAYTQDQLEAISVGNNSISGVRVNDGYSLELYDYDNFSGHLNTYTGPTVVELPKPFLLLLGGEDNKTSSLKLRCLGNIAPVDPCATGLAGAIASSCNGQEISMGIGDYNVARLNQMGMSNGATKEIEVKNGYVFTAFSSDNFGGIARTYTGKHCLSSLHQPKSLRVACLGNIGAIVQDQQLALNAKAEGSRSVLNWTKTTGGVAQEYIVERFDGLMNDYVAIGKVLSNGEEMEYAGFYDENPKEGDNIYRITLVFTDGSIQQSNYDVVRLESLDQVLMYPNPATDLVHIDLSNHVGEAVDIVFINNLGKNVMEQHIEKADFEPISVQTSSLVSGKYFVRIQVAGNRQVILPLVIVRM